MSVLPLDSASLEGSPYNSTLSASIENIKTFIYFFSGWIRERKPNALNERPMNGTIRPCDAVTIAAVTMELNLVLYGTCTLEILRGNQYIRGFYYKEVCKDVWCNSAPEEYTSCERVNWLRQHTVRKLGRNLGLY